MQRWMKLVMALALAISAQTASAQMDEGKLGMRPFASAETYRTFDIKRHEKNFSLSLSHPMPMIVESALAQVVMLKLAQPDVPCIEWQKQIAQLALDGPTPGVRYKAYLAAMAFEQPRQFARIPAGKYRTADDMFIALADEIQRMAFTARELQ